MTTEEEYITEQLELLNEVSKELAFLEAGIDTNIETLAEDVLDVHFEDYVLEEENNTDSKADVVSRTIIKSTSKKITNIINKLGNVSENTFNGVEYKLSSDSLKDVESNGRLNDYYNKNLATLVTYDANLEEPMSIPRTINTMTKRLFTENKFVTKNTHVIAQIASVNFSKLENDSATVTYVKRHVTEFKGNTPYIAQSNLLGEDIELLSFINNKSALGTIGSSVKYVNSTYKASDKTFTGFVNKDEINKLIKWTKQYEHDFNSLKTELKSKWNESTSVFIDLLKAIGKALASGLIGNAELKAGMATTLGGLASINPFATTLGVALTGLGIIQTFRVIIKYITLVWYAIRNGIQFTYGFIRDLSNVPMHINAYVKDVS